MSKNQTLINFGNRVKFFRKQKGLTQFQLANLVNRSEETISNIERGINSTKLGIMEQIAKALEIDIVDFFNCPIANDSSKEKIELIHKLISLAQNQKDLDLLRILVELLSKFK